MSGQHTREASPAVGSATQLLTSLPERQRAPLVAGTLRLRGEPAEQGPTVRWAEGTINNEGMGRKSSKGMNESRVSIYSPLAVMSGMC